MDLLDCDRHSAVPLYYQIHQHLLQDIRAGKLKPGTPLPSEELISKRLHVSRMTARQALKSLCSLGVAHCQRGKGTFVSEIKLEKNREVQSFTEEMEARGSRPHSRLISSEVVPGESEAGDALALSPEEKVIRIRRVRVAHAVPMGVETTCLPQPLCPDLLDRFDPCISLYRTLLQVYGIHIVQADEAFEAGLEDTEEERLLGLPKGSPVFLFTRTAYVEGGKAVEYVKSTFRGERYKIANRLRGRCR